MAEPVTILLAITITSGGIVLLRALRKNSAEGDAATYGEGIVAMANAIAIAEGFGLENTIPTRANNPGNLVLPNWSPTLGTERISVFATPAEGWDRLYRQLKLIVDGRSKVYTLDDTIATMGRKWAPLDAAGNWSANVAQSLNASLSTTLREILA